MAMFQRNDEEYLRTYAQEAAMVDASELIAETLEKSNLNQTDLARKLHISKSEISARLAGERNITVRKLADTLHAMGYKLEVKAVPMVNENKTSEYDHTLDFQKYAARIAESRAKSTHGGGKRPTVSEVYKVMSAQ